MMLNYKAARKELLRRPFQLKLDWNVIRDDFVLAPNVSYFRFNNLEDALQAKLIAEICLDKAGNPPENAVTLAFIENSGVDRRITDQLIEDCTHNYAVLELNGEEDDGD